MDYGAGSGRNAKMLRERGFQVYAYDPYNGSGVDGWNGVSNKLPSGTVFDAAFTAYVLNVVDADTEKKIVKQVSRLTKGSIAHITMHDDVEQMVYDALTGAPGHNKHLYAVLEADDDVEDLMWVQGREYEDIATIIAKRGVETETDKDTFYRQPDLSVYGYKFKEFSSSAIWTK